MASTPQTRTHEGRTVVNRAWMAQRAGVSEDTVKYWYRSARKESVGPTPPPVGPTIDRVGYYDQLDFEKYLEDREAAKRATVTPTDPALYEGDPDDLVDINTAARLFHYTDASVIRGYRRLHPGYFPEPAGTEEGPSGKQIPAFRRGDLIDFDRGRDGDNTGAAGRPAGTPSATAGQRWPVTEHRIDVAHQYMIDLGGWKHGTAAELARRAGEPAKSWERAVKEARRRIEQQNNEDQPPSEKE
ncbi:hypothetical protein OG533_39450 (plasmid) [Streptomyces sp. NBC_01186]|uniref:hypothetical protein n=1 Tax=unclassified Streptomyces TaxID=2593676 RepID=UPI002DD87E60|nr:MULTISPECIES: hypothetical protein [unclassified Streptomyces]WSB81987.1 hypothetical protein OHB04_40340 [Streptomyces sp. NBC_01775]WSS17962.1 hypothetical protein OG533_39450 [Streptomyces sp. NBC_01186]